MCTEKYIFTNDLNMCWPLQARVEKTVHAVETHLLSSNKKVVSAAVSKEGHTCQSSETWKDPSQLISLKKRNCKQFFLLATSKTIFHLIY